MMLIAVSWEAPGDPLTDTQKGNPGGPSPLALTSQLNVETKLIYRLGGNRGLVVGPN